MKSHFADIQPPSNWGQKISGINTGAEVFVGYVLLDALINNTDRHSSNWGVIAVKEEAVERLELMPSFDHALSLGNNDWNEFNLSPSDYVYYHLSAFREGDSNLSTLEVFNRAAELYPQAAAIWKEKLAEITPTQIEEIFNRIPEGRITPTAATFAKALIKHNFEQILGIEFELALERAETSQDLTPQADIPPEPPDDPPASPARKPSKPPNNPDTPGSNLPEAPDRDSDSPGNTQDGSEDFAEEELNPKQRYLKELTRRNNEKKPPSKAKNPYHQLLNESPDARVIIDKEGDSYSNRDDLSL